jgi:hypothetical protein
MISTKLTARWAIHGLIATALAFPAFGQVGIIIGSAPPPLRYERRPPIPGEGYQWMDGYWGVDGGRYVWVPGRWERPPYPGGYWSHPHYDHYPEGWRMHEGHWDREDHSDHHDDHHDQRR